MHHRAAARPETGGEGEKAGRGEEADHGGNRWLRKRTGPPTSPPASLRTGLTGPAPNFRWTQWRERGKRGKGDRHLG